MSIRPGQAGEADRAKRGGGGPAASRRSAARCLIALGTTSVDAAVRRLGARGWQRLHNTIYVVTALALIHYLLSPDIYPEQFLMSGIFFWLIGWRMLNRRGLGTSAGALALLAIAACVFTAVLQVGWIWAYQHYEPSEILHIYFTFNLGIPPMWRILGLGLLIALGVLIKRRLSLIPLP